MRFFSFGHAPPPLGGGTTLPPRKGAVCLRVTRRELIFPLPKKYSNFKHLFAPPPCVCVGGGGRTGRGGDTSRICTPFTPPSLTSLTPPPLCDPPHSYGNRPQGLLGCGVGGRVKNIEVFFLGRGESEGWHHSLVGSGFILGRGVGSNWAPAAGKERD